MYYHSELTIKVINNVNDINNVKNTIKLVPLVLRIYDNAEDLWVDLEDSSRTTNLVKWYALLAVNIS